MRNNNPGIIRNNRGTIVPVSLGITVEPEWKLTYGSFFFLPKY